MFAIAANHLIMNPKCVFERVISFFIGSVDILPRRQHKHWIDKFELFSLNFSWAARPPQSTKQHCMRFNGSSFEEDEAACSFD